MIYAMQKRNELDRILVVGNGSIAHSAAGERFVNNHTGQLLLDLVELGCVPTYIAPATVYSKNSNLLDFELTVQGIDSTILNVGSKVAILWSMLRILHAVKHAKHVYIFYPGTLGVLTAFFCRMMCKPYGLYVRGDRYGHDYLSRKTFKFSSFILTVSPSITEELRSYCSDVVTIRPMLGIRCADKMERQKIQSKPECWQLLFVGNLIADKGIGELMEAAKLLNEKGFPFHLRLVGGGVLYNELINNLKEYGLASNVELSGLVSEKGVLMRAYEKADIFVLPTYHEGFPRVLYEAMIKALPIVTTMVGGIPGRMVDGENCLAIKAMSTEAIVNAIERLSSDVDLYNKIGRNGQNVVLDVLNNSKNHCDLIAEGMSKNVR